ncbi:MAG: hypothetical protein HZA69_02000 [Gammaproteobacteria bacterium]|nr:hypothetical protein [Gammaproteobacteria bacterium]
MTKTLRWQLYVAFYTFCFGVPLLLFPNAIIPFFGFAPTQEPWIHLVGMFLLGLCYISTVIYQQQIVSMLLHSIILRAGFTLVFLALALSGYPPFFYLVAGIVGFGVAGSALAYLSERSTDEPAMPRKTLGDE